MGFHDVALDCTGDGPLASLAVVDPTTALRRSNPPYYIGACGEVASISTVAGRRGGEASITKHKASITGTMGAV